MTVTPFLLKYFQIRLVSYPQKDSQSPFSRTIARIYNFNFDIKKKRFPPNQPENHLVTLTQTIHVCFLPHRLYEILHFIELAEMFTLAEKKAFWSSFGRLRESNSINYEVSRTNSKKRIFNKCLDYVFI